MRLGVSAGVQYILNPEKVSSNSPKEGMAFLARQEQAADREQKLPPPSPWPSAEGGAQSRGVSSHLTAQSGSQFLVPY